MVELCGDQVSVLWKCLPPQTRYSLIGMWTCIGDGIVWDSGMPCWIAAASTNALNVDPGWKPLESPYFWGTT